MKLKRSLARQRGNKQTTDDFNFDITKSNVSDQRIGIQAPPGLVPVNDSKPEINFAETPELSASFIADLNWQQLINENLEKKRLEQIRNKQVYKVDESCLKVFCYENSEISTKRGSDSFSYGNAEFLTKEDYKIWCYDDAEVSTKRGSICSSSEEESNKDCKVDLNNEKAYKSYARYISNLLDTE